MGAGYGFGGGCDRRAAQHGLGGPGGAWRGLGDAPSGPRSASARPTTLFFFVSFSYQKREVVFEPEETASCTISFFSLV